MTSASRTGLARRWHSVRRASARVPLRIKLIAAELALVAIALAITSFAGISLLQGYLLGQADARLRVMVNQVHNFHEFGGENVLSAPDQFVLGALTAQGRFIVGSAYLRQPQAGPAVPTESAWLSAHSGRFTTVRASSGGDFWRIVAYPGQATVVYRNGSSSPATLVAGLDVTNVYQTIARLRDIDVIVSVIVLAGLAIVGVAIVRTSLRPLADIERTAERIASGDLSQRVPDHDPATEIGRLARSLNLMLAQIETAFRARAASEASARRSEERMRQLVADASHELRTPLTAIRGFAEYYRQRGGISGDGGALAKDELDRIMQRVEQESSRMSGLVEDMLLLARLDQQRPLDFRPVDLLTLAADAVQDARMIAPARPVTLTVGADAAFLVLGDEARLRQVVANLMSNALTHTPDTAPVEVRLGAGDRAPAPSGQPVPPSVILEVADQGPGLTAEQAEHVYERFYRADQARDRKTGGSGLGLAIVAALVAAHGGMTGVRSAPGQGSTFWFTVPLAPEANGQPPAEREQAGQTPADPPGRP